MTTEKNQGTQSFKALARKKETVTKKDQGTRADSALSFSGFAPISRRAFSIGLGAAGLATLGLGVPKVRAASTVTFLGWQGYETPMSSGGYLEKNDITLQTTYIANTEDIIAKLKAGGIGTIDLATPNIAYVPLLTKMKLLAPIDVSMIPNYAHVMPFFADQELLSHEGKQYAVPFTWGTQPLMYRPDLVTEVPTSWLDVLKPEYKGKVVMTGSHVGNIQVWGKVVTGAEVPSWLTPAQLKETIDFLIKIKKEHALTYTDSYGEMADIFARGEAVISTMGWEPVASWVAKKGVELAYTYPKEGTTGFIDTYVIPKNAPNYELDHGLINNALSTAAQVVIAEDSGQGIVNTTAIEKLSPDAKKAYPYDDMDTLVERAKFYPFPPIEDDGVHATYDMIIREWERFLRS